MEFPSTLPEFETAYPDEHACWEALRRARWPRGFVCPRCENPSSSWIATRRLEQCRACRDQASVTAGTVFHRTRIPLRTWFWAIFFVARHKQGISALQVQRDLGLGSYQTAWTMLHKIRSALRPRPSHRLRGNVEVDEAYIGSVELGRSGGRQAGNKTIVVGAVERREHHAGRVRLGAVQGVSFERDLGPFVRGVIDDRETTLYTDGFGAYHGFAKAGIQTVQQIQGNPRRAGEILPWVHRVFGNLKSWICGTFHGVSRKHMPRYLDEFTYRFDRRWRETEMFGVVLHRTLQAPPFLYHRPVAEAVG